MATSEKVFYSQKNVLNYNFYLQPSHIKLNPSIYFVVPLVDQLTPMGFIPSSAFTRTLTMLENKDSNSSLIAPC